MNWDEALKDDCVGAAIRELQDKHPEMAQDQMLAIALDKCGQSTKAANPDDYAYVPDKETPSSWKLDISDPEHIAGAITALQSGGFRGQKVEIPSADKPGVIRRISGAIDRLVSDPDQKKNLHERLDAVKAGRMISAVNAEPLIAAVRHLMDVLNRAGIQVDSETADENANPADMLAAKYFDLPDDERIVAYGGAIKAIGDNRFGGYAVTWGSKAQKDLDQQYFTDHTDFWLKYFQPPRPFIYHHGLDKTLGKSVVGDIDTLKADNQGLYVEGEYSSGVGNWTKQQIDLHNQYVRAVKELVQRGVIGFSTGSMSHLVEFGPDGEIKSWPIGEISGTPTPADQRGNRVYNLKSIKELIIDPLSVSEAEKPKGLGGIILPSGKEAKAADTPMMGNVDLETQVESPSEDEMDMQKMCQMALDALKRAGIALSPEQEQAFVASMQQAYPNADQPQPGMDAAAVQKMAESFVAKAFDVAAALKAQEVQEAAFNAALKARIENAPIINDLPPAKAVKTNSHISVGSKFDGLAPEDIVYGVHIMSEAAKAHIGHAEPPSDTMLRAAHERVLKAVDYDNNPWGQESHAVKSAFQAVKSDEIIATNVTAPGLWVGTAYSAQLWEQVRIATIYQEFLNRGMMDVTVPQGFSSIYIPTDGGANTTWYSLVELNDETSDERMPITAKSSVIAPSRRQITLGFVGARNSFTDIMTEDSLIPVLPFLRRNHEITAKENFEYMWLNGDTVTTASTNLNLIDGTPSVDAKGRGPSYLGVDGMLKLPIITTTTLSRDGKGFDESDFLATINLLPATEQSDESKLMFIVGQKTYTAALNIPAFKTRDVFNPATLEGGKLTGVYGVDLFKSGQMALANTAGKISATPTNNIYGRILCVRPDRWALGRHREVTTEVARDIDAQATVVVTTLRFGITSFATTGGAAVTYDLTVST